MSLVSCITLYFNRAEEGKGFQGEEVGQIYAPGQGEGREEATVPADAGETSVGPMPWAGYGGHEAETEEEDGSGTQAHWEGQARAEEKH